MRDRAPARNCTRKRAQGAAPAGRRGHLGGTRLISRGRLRAAQGRRQVEQLQLRHRSPPPEQWRSGSGKQPPSARQQRSRCSSSRAAPPAGWRPTGSSSSTDAGSGTRASRKHSQPSSSTAPPASHGRRWPTSSAPPGTALVPAAAGRARAPTKSTRRANASTAPPSGGRPAIRSIIAKRAAAAGVAGRVSTVRAAGRWIQDRRSSSVCVRRHAGLPHGDQPC